MLANDIEKKEKKSDYFKDILIALMVLVISIGCFFTYNPANAPLDIGSDGMNFATYPLGVASFLTVLDNSEIATSSLTLMIVFFIS